VQYRQNRPENQGQDFYLRVETEMQALNNVLQWFEDAIKSLLPDRDTVVWQSKLALTEGFTNTVSHAHRNLPKETPIQLKLTIAPNYLLMEIWDQGEPFDLMAKLEDITHNPLNPLEQESDRGLWFMKQLTDDLEYLRDNQGQNCLRMLKILDFGNSSFN
jgi:serine/threonine-protein kinase RsbW